MKHKIVNALCGDDASVEAAAAVLRDAVGDGPGLLPLMTAWEEYGLAVGDIPPASATWGIHDQYDIDRIATVGELACVALLCAHIHEASALLDAYQWLGDTMWARVMHDKERTLSYVMALFKSVRATRADDTAHRDAHHHARTHRRRHPHSSCPSNTAISPVTAGA